MKVEIVEIGTSDFRTEAGKKKGLFVEPIKEYYDRLPKCLKENVAVSNYNGEIDIYYIPSSRIEGLGLPNWLRGCNSVNHIHPTILSMGFRKHVVKNTVEVVRIKDLLLKHDITDIELLKIDTEGHDCVILNDFLDTCTIRPKTIQFENNSLSDQEEVIKLCERLHEVGYTTQQIKFDMICVLS
jgi:FkbM family methyltransferase